MAPQQPRGAGSARMNEFFVPEDGIDREVITADICRYLGEDTLVRPGNFEASEKMFCEFMAHGNAESDYSPSPARFFYPIV